MDRSQLDNILEEWADYVRGGRSLRTSSDSLLSAIITFKGAPPRVGYDARLPDIDGNPVAVYVEGQVRQLNTTKPSMAAVLRTEYGLNRNYDSRGQHYRAAKMELPLRTYKYKLSGARSFIGEALDRYFQGK